jgi:hypothetical protein
MPKQNQERREIFRAQTCVLEHADRLVLRFADCGVHAGRLDVSEVNQHPHARTFRGTGFLSATAHRPKTTPNPKDAFGMAK